MALHLFSKPVQCTQCGTVVDDPTVDRCPKCGALLRERRAPRRLAGVEARYGSLRILLAGMRFLGFIVLLVGGLVFFATLGEDGQSTTQSAAILLVAVLVAMSMFAASALFDLVIDVEENTRSSFRLQQLILEELQEANGAVAHADGPVLAPPPAPDVTLTRPVDAVKAS